jgi:hypothetical protein
MFSAVTLVERSAETERFESLSLLEHEVSVRGRLPGNAYPVAPTLYPHTLSYSL